MDTLEWGADVPDEGGPPWWRRWPGPQHAPLFAGVGVCALFVSAFGPWLTARPMAALGVTDGAPTGLVSVGVGGLGGAPMSYFYGGWVVLLALVGLALFGRARHRRAAVGLGSGVAVGIGFCLLVVVQSMQQPLLALVQGSSFAATTAGSAVHPAWGLWIGVTALALMVAALGCTQLPGLAPAEVADPVAESAEGLELVVAEARPLDERLFASPPASRPAISG